MINRMIKLVTFFLLITLLTACSAIPASISELSEILSTQAPNLTMEVKPITYNQEPTAAVQATEESDAQAPVVQSQASQQSYAQDLQTALVNLYQIANPATVYIINGQGSGSGFVYDASGHIVTNNHVVEGSRQVEVVFASGERLLARLVGADADSDLAVIKVDELPAGINPLPIAPFETVQVGQIVAAIGNPFGEQGSMSMGIVSGVGRSLQSQRSGSNMGNYSLPEVVQTDAPINPGNSGGPLLNLSGEVIGVNSAIATTSGSNSGVGFAIPSKAVERIVPVLISEGEYTYSYMGVAFDNEISLDELSTYGVEQTQGVYLLQINPGGPADRAGMRAADPQTGKGGDLIVAIDGQPVKNFGDLNSYLVFNTSPNQTIQLTILRNGEQLEISLTLGARP